MDNLIYQIHLNPNTKSPFVFCEWMESRNNIITNWHTSLELLFFTDGCGQVLCDGEYTDVKAGDLFIVNLNCVHNIITDECVGYHCFIIDNYFFTMNDIDIYNLTFNSKITNEEVISRVKKVIDELSANTDFNTAGIRSATLDLLVFLCRNYSFKNAFQKRNSKINAIENIKIALGYIQSHFNQKLNLETLAYETGLSKFHLSREFKNFTGKTVITHINILRCEYAKKLLKSKKYTISDICQMSGFENPNYFAKLYKKTMGKKPSEE